MLTYEYMKKELLSTAELAKILGISRVAVFKKIRNGNIHAEKVGRNYVVSRDELPKVLGKVLSEAKKARIESTIKRAVTEYGEALKKLSRE